MLVKDALNILHPEGTTIEAIKISWRRACSKYHPDRGGSISFDWDNKTTLSFRHLPFADAVKLAYFYKSLG